MFHTPKRLFVGRPLRSDRLGETLLPKRLAMPVFCSDPLSSVAYATEQILLVLGLGGLGLLYLRRGWAWPWSSFSSIVVASYRQTCHAYPERRRRLRGQPATTSAFAASLVAASALLVDYVLTVAVSVVAGVARSPRRCRRWLRTRSASRSRLVVLLTVMNLRGVKESGRAFAVPTYGFVAHRAVLLAVAGLRLADGRQPSTAESASYGLVADHRTGGLLTVFLALRAFACGCTALTGVEAVSNGVPALRGAEVPATPPRP